jgi:hypothetical protein
MPGVPQGLAEQPGNAKVAHSVTLSMSAADARALPAVQTHWFRVQFQSCTRKASNTVALLSR